MNLDEYDMDAMREDVVAHYYKKFNDSKSVEDEIEYVNVGWKSDYEIFDLAISMGLDLSKYVKTKKH